jgi:molybdopterin-guanine dinucleotide biosynthesis protein B
MGNIVAFVGHSDSGKTSLIERLVAILRKKGYRVGVLKHTHARIRVDRKGTDTDRFRLAGAAVSAIADDRTLVRFESVDGPMALVAALAAEVDMLLVEGHKSLPLPKVLLSDSLPRAGLKGVVATYGHKTLISKGLTPKHFSPKQAPALAEWLVRTLIGKGKRPRVRLSVDGNNIGIKDYVTETMAGVVAGLVRPLKGGRGRKVAVSIDFGVKI